MARLLARSDTGMHTSPKINTRRQRRRTIGNAGPQCPARNEEMYGLRCDTDTKASHATNEATTTSGEDTQGDDKHRPAGVRTRTSTPTANARSTPCDRRGGATSPSARSPR